MAYSRRHFGQLAAAGIGTLAYARGAFAQAKPNSVVAGIQVGVMVPNSMHGVADDLGAYRDALLKIGLSGCEVHEEPFERFAGAPKSGGRQALSAWRLAAPMDKFAQGRKLWNDAGIGIYAFKTPVDLAMPDAECDYVFNLAKILGAGQLTMEMPDDPAITARVGKFAEKHRLLVGYHAHGQATPTYWDNALAQSPFNGINLDVGHYVGAGNKDAIAFVEKNHARITSMHLKDRKLGGPNMPWGQGDTPIIPILRMIRDRKWGFPVTIELEYPVPENSTMPDEVARCYAYIRAALRS